MALWPGKSMETMLTFSVNVQKLAICAKKSLELGLSDSPLKASLTPIFGSYVVSLYMAAPNPSFAIKRLWLKST